MENASDQFRIRPNEVARHVVALVCAAVIVLGLHVQDWNIQKLLGRFDQSTFTTYTPYFPGMHNLETHELFDPRYKSFKKIVFLGASAVESIGCDGSWSVPDKTRNPERNVNYSCSLVGQFNELLKERGIKGWRAFDLGRNGGALTPMLYVYARAMEVKPELVVYGETFSIYTAANAGCGFLPSEFYPHLDAVFSDPVTKPLWLAYRQRLKEGAVTLHYDNWQLPPYDPQRLPSLAGTQPRQHTSLQDIAVWLLERLRKAVVRDDAPPLPVKLYPNLRRFDTPPPNMAPFVNPDPGLGYFHGFELINAKQHELGGNMQFYFLPQYDGRDQPNYIAALKSGVFSQYMDQVGISHKSFMDFPLKPVVETYDGNHQTKQGNRRLAGVMLDDLLARNFITVRQP